MIQSCSRPDRAYRYRGRRKSNLSSDKRRKMERSQSPITCTNLDEMSQYASHNSSQSEFGLRRGSEPAQLQDHRLAMRTRVSKDFVPVHSRRTSAQQQQQQRQSQLVSDLLDSVDEKPEDDSFVSHTPPPAELSASDSSITVSLEASRSQPSTSDLEACQPLQPISPQAYLQVDMLRRAPGDLENDYIEIDGHRVHSVRRAMPLSPEGVPPLLSQPSHFSDAVLSSLDLSHRLPSGSQCHLEWDGY